MILLPLRLLEVSLTDLFLWGFFYRLVMLLCDKYLRYCYSLQ